MAPAELHRRLLPSRTTAMIRAARPGDTCILIRDSEHDGRNLGKLCLVRRQCVCDPGDWEVETLESWDLWEGIFSSFYHRVRCPAGERCCVPKSNLRPLTDPDSQETDHVPHSTPAHS